MNQLALRGCAAFALATALNAQAQTTITAWTFDNLPVASNNAPAPSIGTGNATPLGMTNNYTYSTNPAVTGSVAAADVLLVAGANNEWRVRGASPGNGWNLAAPQYSQGAQFSASTVGYSGIVLKYDWFSTNQGVRNLQAQYTTNGTAWTSIGAVQVAVPNAYQAGLTLDFSGIGAVNNNASFAVRLVSAFDPSFIGSPTYTAATLVGGLPVAYNNNSGNWRFDNVTITGVTAPVPEPATLALTLAGLGVVGLVARRRCAG